MSENNQELNSDEVQIGRILHFVIDNGWGLKCRPAIVVEDWPGQGKPGYCNLVVFPDGSNDQKYGIDNHNHKYQDAFSPEEYRTGTSDKANVPLLTRWETSVLPNHAVRAHRTWHWPRECIHMQEPAPPIVDSTRGKIHHNHAVGFIDPHNCYACKLEIEQALA